MPRVTSLLLGIVLFIGSLECRKVYSQMQTPQETDKSYCLVDPGTQVPIEKYTIPAHWVASGKVVWNLNDAGNAVLWAAKFCDPKNWAVAKICSPVTFGGTGGAMQNASLQNPNAMANLFLSDIQEVAGSTGNFQITSAKFSPCEIPDILDQLRKLVTLIPNTSNQQARIFEAEFTYKCDAFYHPEDEGGILWNDPDIGIDWPIPPGTSPLISAKDERHPSFQAFCRDNAPVCNLNAHSVY